MLQIGLSGHFAQQVLELLLARVRAQAPGRRPLYSSTIAPCSRLWTQPVGTARIARSVQAAGRIGPWPAAL